MNELKDTNPNRRPLDKAQLGAEVGALNALLNFVNNPNITGAELPADVKGAVVVAPPGVIPQIATPPVSTPSPRSIAGNRFAFSGRLKVGKDHIASTLGAHIIGFADPLYYLQDYFFGTTAVTDPKQKDIPGARAFLQAVGQWGWGAVNEKYPLTPARACFIRMIRSLGGAGEFPEELRVEWAEFGKDKLLWVKSALARTNEYLDSHPQSRVAIVNARFEHEYKPLQAAGFEMFHVMCSPKTWTERLAKSNLTPQSPAVNDISEKLSHALDADVIRKISAQKSGPMLKAIWNDENVPSPSPRLYSLTQFLQHAAIAAIPEEASIAAAE